jgi:hypothetical protein
VNSFIKRLAKKGYFKVTNIPKNRVRYILTPKGMAEKTRLTYKYIQYSFQFYRNTRQILKKIFYQFEKQHIEKVIFWGTGELSEIAYLSMQESKVVLAAIVDEKEAGNSFFGITIIKASEIKSIEFEMVLITSTEWDEHSIQSIIELGVDSSRIQLIR